MAGNAVSNEPCFACGMKCVRSKSVRCVGARRTMTATLKRTRSGGCVVL